MTFGVLPKGRDFSSRGFRVQVLGAWFLRLLAWKGPGVLGREVSIGGGLGA